MRSRLSLSRGIKYRGGAPSNPKKLGNTPITRGIVGCWPSWSELGKDGVADGAEQLYDISPFRTHATLETDSDEPGYGVSVLQAELKLPGVIIYDNPGDARIASTATAPPHLLITGDVTMSLWFDLRATNLADYFLAYGLSGESLETNVMYSLSVGTGAKLRYHHEFGAGTNVLRQSVNALSLNTAYHVVCVRRGLTVKAWINGVEEINGSFTSGQVPTTGTSGKFSIGGVAPSGSQIEAGIAFPTIWNRALTDSEALSLYTRGTRWQMFETVADHALPGGLLGISNLVASGGLAGNGSVVVGPGGLAA
jgi:hypothetical protein